MIWVAPFLFAVLNEAVIEYLLGSVQMLRPYIPLLSLATAILLVFAYQVSLFQVFLGIQISPFFDLLFSAIIIARLSNYLNDFVRKFLGSK